MNAQLLIIDVRGLICEKYAVWDPIPFADVFAIPSDKAAEDEGEGVLSRRDARQLSQDEMQQIAGGRGLVRGRTDENGRLETQEGAGERAWDVYVCIRSVRTPAGEKPYADLPEPVCLFAGTYRVHRGVLTVYIPVKLYCLLKRRVDAWTIAGRLEVCGTSQAITGATVTAFDTDWLQHDNLGSDVTDGTGRFRIDYPGSKFRRGTWIDVELFGGPDVHFRVEDSGGTPLIEEPPSAGRAPGRRDRGPCFCVDLCAPIGGGSGDPVPNAWVRVGSAFLIPDASGLNDFDAAGYAGAARWALFSTVVMRGYVARLTPAGNPIEYRFRVSSTTAANGAPPVPAASFTRDVDGTGPTPLFASVHLGDLVRVSPLKIVAVVAHASDLKPGGWLNVDQVVKNAFAAEPAFAGNTLGVDVLWGRNDSLTAVNTTGLTTEADVPAAAANAGQGVPPGDQTAIEKFAFRFEIREVDATTGTPVGFLPASGTTLNSAIINNNPSFQKLTLASGPLCAPQTGTVQLAYTAYHVHLRTVTLNVRSADFAYNNDQVDVPLPADGILPLTGNTDPARVQVFNPSFAVTPALTQQCAYLAKMRVFRRLHTGDTADSGVQVDLPFFFS